MPSADDGPGLCAFRLLFMKQGFRNSRGQAIWNKPFKSDADYGSGDSEAGQGRCLQGFPPQRRRPVAGDPGFSGETGADYDHLYWIEQQPLQGQSVRASIEAEMLHNAGKGGERLPGDLAILPAAGEGFESQQG